MIHPKQTVWLAVTGYVPDRLSKTQNSIQIPTPRSIARR